MGRCPYCGAHSSPEMAAASESEITVFVCPECQAILGTHPDEKLANRQQSGSSRSARMTSRSPVNQSCSADDLKEHLDTFVDHVTSIRESHNLDDMREAGIKVKIITPLVGLLGWDIMTPEVKFEVWTGAGDADYALCLDDTPVVLIEAKAPHKSLDNAEEQLREYLDATSTMWGLSSNGRRYRLYRFDNSSVTTVVDVTYDNLPECSNDLIEVHRKTVEK